MWDDVIIGKGNKGNSAFTYFDDGNFGVSENKVSYWISNVYLRMGMTVFKDTVVGKMIPRLEKKDLKKYLTIVLLRRVNKKKLQVKIENALQEAFSAGKTAKVEEIRNALRF